MNGELKVLVFWVTVETVLLLVLPESYLLLWAPCVSSPPLLLLDKARPRGSSRQDASGALIRACSLGPVLQVLPSPGRGLAWLLEGEKCRGEKAQPQSAVQPAQP